MTGFRHHAWLSLCCALLFAAPASAQLPFGPTTTAPSLNTTTPLDLAAPRYLMDGTLSTGRAVDERLRLRLELGSTFFAYENADFRERSIENIEDEIRYSDDRSFYVETRVAGGFGYSVHPDVSIDIGFLHRGLWGARGNDSGTDSLSQQYLRVPRGVQPTLDHLQAQARSRLGLRDGFRAALLHHRWRACRLHARRYGRRRELPHLLDHLDGDVLVLVVAQGHLPGGAVDPVGHPPVVGAHALGHDVEGLAHGEVDLLVLGRVTDAVLAQQLTLARLGLAVDPHDPRRQRHAQTAGLAVLEGVADPDVLPVLGHAAPEVLGTAAHGVVPRDRDPGRVEQRDLLAAVVGQVGRPGHGVEVIVVEGLVLHLTRSARLHGVGGCVHDLATRRARAGPD